MSDTPTAGTETGTTESTLQEVEGLEIKADDYHECETCHTTVDIPLDLKLQLDSGLFQDGKEVTQVDLNEDWYVNVYWCLKGGLAKTTCVDWCVAVHFESIGDDPEFEVRRYVKTRPCRRCWRLHIPGGQIEVDRTECGDVYRLVVVVTARDKCYRKPVGITGFCDLGLVEFYTGHTDTDD